MGFKVGEKITYYDINTDAFVSREILFIYEGWAVVARDEPGFGGAPFSATPLTAASPFKDDPIGPGMKVRSGGGTPATVIAVDALSAWVRYDHDDAGGEVIPLAKLAHAPD